MFMSLNNPIAGFGHAAEFQSSALPWMTSSTAPAAGSPVRFDFPKITRFITVTNLAATTNTLSFGFTRNGIVSSSNKYIVGPAQTITVDLRVRNIFIQGENGTPSYNLLAGLTNVPASEMDFLSGTLPDGTSGWNGVG